MRVDPRDEQPRELVGDRPRHVDALRGEAHLPRPPVRREHDPVDGLGEVGILENHGRVVAAEFEVDRKERLGGLPHDVARRRAAAGEGNLAHAAIVEQRAHDVGISVHDVEHARRKLGGGEAGEQ